LSEIVSWGNKRLRDLPVSAAWLRIAAGHAAEGGTDISDGTAAGLDPCNCRTAAIRAVTGSAGTVFPRAFRFP